MPQPRGARARLAVRFDELAFAEDLRHATPAGRQVARAARARFEHDAPSSASSPRATPSTVTARACPDASIPPRAG
jgi:hypothetical protein